MIVATVARAPWKRRTGWAEDLLPSAILNHWQ